MAGGYGHWSSATHALGLSHDGNLESEQVSERPSLKRRDELGRRRGNAATWRPTVAEMSRRRSGRALLWKPSVCGVPWQVQRSFNTDDIAWRRSRFGWQDVMIDGVLEPVHREQSVHYQLPTWPSRRRAGHTDVSGKASLVIIEGVGAGRREFNDLLDAVVWVHSDAGEAEGRGILPAGAMRRLATAQ